MEQDSNSTRIDVSVPHQPFRVTSSGLSNSEPAAEAKLEVGLDVINGMTDGAKQSYVECVRKYAAALAREASRLEQADRAEEISDPEITSSMVVKANDYLRHPQAVPAKISIIGIAAQMTAFATGIMTPIFGADLHSNWQWIAMVACGIIALASQLYAVLVTVRRK